MRRFIYLDTETLNSYLAQIFDGVIQSQETEKTVGKKREKQHRFANSLGGQIAFKLFGKGVLRPIQSAPMMIEQPFQFWNHFFVQMEE